VAGPGLAANLLTVYEPTHLLETYHYASYLVPVVVVSAIYGAERAASLGAWLAIRVRLPLRNPERLLVLALSVGVLGCTIVYHYYRGYTPLSPSFAWPRVADHHAVGRRIAASIPPEAAVSAQSNVQ